MPLLLIVLFVLVSWSPPSRANARDAMRAPEVAAPSKIHHHVRQHRARHHSTARVVGALASLDAKVRELGADCGARVISGYRPGARVAGSGRVSEHAYDHARDLRGDYACIYRHLAGWPGGYSTDPGRVGHVHVSLGGPEDGRRFAHGGSWHRYARVRGAYAYRTSFHSGHWRRHPPPLARLRSIEERIGSHGTPLGI